MIYHLSTPDEWAAAQLTGDYTSSSRDRTLAEEGFIHCSRAEQIAAVLEKYYGGAGPLLILFVDTGLLTSPWQDDEIAPGVFYPHVYGPINVAAVVAVTPLEPGADGAYEVPSLA
jgi:uncharacterized protein (DUF952 family)